MWRVCLCLALLACSKKSSDVKKDAAVVAPEREEKMSDKSAADIMADKMAKAKEEAAAQTPPPPPTPAPTTPEPVAPAPAPPPTPDELPPEETVADSGSGSDAAPVFKIGERVMAKWDNAKWYPGKIVGIKDGKYDVDYDDGDKSRGLVAHRVRKMPDPTKPPAK